MHTVTSESELPDVITHAQLKDARLVMICRVSKNDMRHTGHLRECLPVSSEWHWDASISNHWHFTPHTTVTCFVLLDVN